MLAKRELTTRQIRYTLEGRIALQRPHLTDLLADSPSLNGQLAEAITYACRYAITGAWPPRAPLRRLWTGALRGARIPPNRLSAQPAAKGGLFARRLTSNGARH